VPTTRHDLGDTRFGRAIPQPANLDTRNTETRLVRAYPPHASAKDLPNSARLVRRVSLAIPVKVLLSYFREW